MNAIYIDSRNRVVRSLGDAKPTLEWLYERLGCFMVTCVRLNNEGDVMWLDDDGLNHKDQTFFIWDGYLQPFAGNGVIMGTKPDGESCGVKATTLEDVTKRVRFVNAQEAIEYAKDCEEEVVAASLALRDMFPDGMEFISLGGSVASIIEDAQGADDEKAN